MGNGCLAEVSRRGASILGVARVGCYNDTGAHCVSRNRFYRLRSRPPDGASLIELVRSKPSPRMRELNS